MLNEAASSPASAGRLRTMLQDDTLSVAQIIGYVREVEAVTDAADAAVDGAYQRFAALGGVPKTPEALFVRPGDGSLDIFGSIRCDEVGRYMVSEAFAANLRKHPRVQRIEVRRPGTIEDGFTETEVSDGYNEIVKQRVVPWPEAQARADEIVAAYDWAENEETRRSEMSGYAAARKAVDDATSLFNGWRTRAIKARAASIDEIILKVRVVSEYFEDILDLDSEVENSELSADYRFALSITRDLALLSGIFSEPATGSPSQPVATSAGFEPAFLQAAE